MAEKTDFAGLTRLLPAESLSEDNFAFQNADPLILDYLTRVGAVTHRHDGHAALADPLDAPGLTTDPAGGTIPAETVIYAAYSLVDANGGETLATPVAMVTTQQGLAVPDDSPVLVPDALAGTLLAGSYSYAITVTDGSGGESGLGPSTTIVIQPGSPTNEIVVSGLAAIVTANGGTGYRLWRSVNGGDWNLVNVGVTDTVTDDGSLCPNCNVTPPDGTTNLTNATNTVTITVPLAASSDAVAYRVYVSEDPLLGSPALVGQYAVTPAALDPIVLTTLDALLDGTPPPRSLALPGASPVDARTEVSNLRWLYPVADDAERDALPGTTDVFAGSVVLTLSDGALNTYDETGVWHKAGGGGGIDTTAWHWAGIYDPATAYVANAVVAYRAAPADPYVLYFTSTDQAAGTTPDPATAGWWKLGDGGGGAAVTPGHVIVGQEDDGAGSVSFNVDLPTRAKLAFTGKAVATVQDATTINVNVDAPSTSLVDALAAGGAVGPKPIAWADIPLDPAFFHAIDITPALDVYKVQCMLDVNGFVHLRGRATTSASGASQLLGTLPAIMRPAHTIRIPHVNNGGTQVTPLSIFPNGNIYVSGFSADVDLDGIHFYSETGALGGTPITPALNPGITPDAGNPLSAHGGPKTGSVTGCVNAASPASFPLALGTFAMHLADAMTPSEYSQFDFTGTATYNVTAGPDTGQTGTLDVTLRLIDLSNPALGQSPSEGYEGLMEATVLNPSGALTDMASDTIHICLDNTYLWSRVHIISG